MKKALLALALLFATSAFAQSPPPHGVLLNWSWSQGTSGAAVGFSVKRATVSGGPYLVIKNLTDASLRSYDDVDTATNPLAEGQKYFYVITALGNGGTESAPSNESSATIPFRVPQAPTSLQAVPR